MKPNRRTFLTLTAASLAAASVPAIAHHEEKAPKPVEKPVIPDFVLNYTGDGEWRYDPQLRLWSEVVQFQPNHRK